MTKNTKDTIVAFIRTGAALAAVILAACGVDIDALVLQDVATVVAACAVVAWGCWKNNNFTEAASDAHELLLNIKSQKGYALDPADLEDEEDE